MVLYDELLKSKLPNGDLQILAGLEEFRIHLGGQLNITLPTGIGCAKEIHQMDFDLIQKAIDVLATLRT